MKLKRLKSKRKKMLEKKKKKKEIWELNSGQKWNLKSKKRREKNIWTSLERRI